MIYRLRLACALLAAPLLVGCGDGGPPRVPVSGKVTANGQPVNGGNFTFAPMASGPTADSAPVVAAVNADGTFKVDQGAVAGRYRVIYSAPNIPWTAPEWNGVGPRPEAPKGPYDGMEPKLKEVEFAAGGSEVAIELVPAGSA